MRKKSTMSGMLETGAESLQPTRRVVARLDHDDDGEAEAQLVTVETRGAALDNVGDITSRIVSAAMLFSGRYRYASSFRQQVAKSRVRRIYRY
jgi:hypothetical protein